MSKVQCSECQDWFSRKDVMKRHQKRKHGYLSKPLSTLQEVSNPVVSRAYQPLPQYRQTSGVKDSVFYNSLRPDQTRREEAEDPRYQYFLNATPVSQLPPLCPHHKWPWKHPFTCLIAGPTGSGKTAFVKRFVSHVTQMVHPAPDRITWHYGEYQTGYGTVEGVDFVEGLPRVDDIDPSVRSLIVLDDLMTEANDLVTSLFTKKSHHNNVSVVYIVQNLFHQTKTHRNISLNTHYILLMKNPRDASQINRLSQQMFPQKTKLLQEAYADATSRPHGHLMIDLKQDTPEEIRLRTNIFPGEWQTVYLA